MKGRLCDSQVRDCVIVHLGLNVSSSVHDCWCVIDGDNAMAAIGVLLLLLLLLLLFLSSLLLLILLLLLLLLSLLLSLIRNQEWNIKPRRGRQRKCGVSLNL